MRKINKVLMVFLVFVMFFTFSACGGNNNDNGGDNDEIELLVDMHGWMPTLNTVPTLENPKVINASRLIAEEFYKQTGIKIKWARSKPVGGLEAELGEWFATQIAGDTCPVIAFSWGTRFQDRDYYMDLTQIVEEVNEFTEGQTVWKDMYEDYIWDEGSVIDAADRIVAIPISLYAGSPTGYFYNKDIFSELSIEVPGTYEEYVTAAKAIAGAGYVGSAPWGYFKKYTLGNWMVNQSIGPSIAAKIMNQVDTDSNGRISAQEQINAVKANLFNPKTHDYAREYYIQAKRYYKEVLPEGWLNTDYMNAWDTGRVGMKEEGIWALYDQMNQPAIEYEVGVFPIPQFSTDSSPFATTVQMTEKGPYQPAPDLTLNIMKPAIEHNPALLEPAVKFLKFLTLPENISMMCEEQGAVLGAVKGSTYNSILDEYLNQPFPITPKISWPIAFTSLYNDKLDRSFGYWVLDSKTDEEFFADVEKFQNEGAADLAGKMGLVY